MPATMTPAARAQAIDAAADDFEAQGVQATNRAIHDATGIGWNAIKKRMMERRAQHRAASHPAVLRPAPVAPLLAKKQRCAEYDATWRDHEREGQQLGQDRAECWSDYRQGLIEARRLQPLFLQAHQASRLAVYAGNEQVQMDYQRLRSQLVALVGEGDVQKLESHPTYTPWWLTAER